MDTTLAQILQALFAENAKVQRLETQYELLEKEYLALRATIDGETSSNGERAKDVTVGS